MSASIGIQGANQQIVAIVMPDSWDDAPITFQWSLDSGFWHDVFTRDGHEQNFIWTPSAIIPIASQYMFYTYPYLQIRSGSRAKPIVQSADRWFAVLSQ
jgi:hypothetical protein